jgi:hypothetical protein
MSIESVRRDWKDKREKHLKDHGYQQDDHLAISKEKAEELKGLDKVYKEKLNRIAEEHERRKEHASRKKRDAKHYSDKRVNTVAFVRALASLDTRTDRSRSWLKKSGVVKDGIDRDINRYIETGTERLQWAFTHQPMDPCCVPFVQTIQMKEQQQALADAARLVFEYSDKLPRWAKLASVNQGRAFKPQPSPIAARAMRSILLRHWARALSPALRKTLHFIRHDPEWNRIERSHQSQQHWSKVRSLRKSILSLPEKEHQAAEAAKRTSREEAPHALHRRSIVIHHMDAHHGRERIRSSMEGHGEVSHDHHQRRISHDLAWIKQSAHIHEVSPTRRSVSGTFHLGDQPFFLGSPSDDITRRRSSAKMPVPTVASFARAAEGTMLPEAPSQMPQSVDQLSFFDPLEAAAANLVNQPRRGSAISKTSRSSSRGSLLKIPSTPSVDVVHSSLDSSEPVPAVIQALQAAGMEIPPLESAKTESSESSSTSLSEPEK